MIIGGKCQGCNGRLDYVLDASDGIPEIYPRDSAVAYRGGHLCTSCAVAVADLIKTRRARQASIAEDQIDAAATDGRLSSLAMRIAIDAGIDWPSINADEQDGWHERAIALLRNGEISL